MPSLNKIMLIGNVTRDHEVKSTSTGKAVATLGLAINRSFGQGDQKKEETTYVDVELWGRLAEIAGEYAKKGSPIFIEGRLALESWEDKQTEKNRSKLKVVAENLQLLGSRGGQAENPGPKRQTRPAGHAVPDDEDGIPFAPNYL